VTAAVLVHELIVAVAVAVVVVVILVVTPGAVLVHELTVAVAVAVIFVVTMMAPAGGIHSNAQVAAAGFPGTGVGWGGGGASSAFLTRLTKSLLRVSVKLCSHLLVTS
jgi:hypothetical protein